MITDSRESAEEFCQRRDELIFKFLKQQLAVKLATRAVHNELKAASSVSSLHQVVLVQILISEYYPDVTFI